jgi:hypothetical protein
MSTELVLWDAYCLQQNRYLVEMNMPYRAALRTMKYLPNGQVRVSNIVSGRSGVYFFTDNIYNYFPRPAY